MMEKTLPRQQQIQLSKILALWITRRFGANYRRGSAMYVCANIIMVENYRYCQQKGDMTVFPN